MRVDKAVAALAGQGLVDRNSQSGSFVAHLKMQAAVLTIPDLRAEAEAQRRPFSVQGLEDEQRPACCVHLGAEGHHLGPSRFIRTLHSIGDRPVMIEERHIFLDTVPRAEMVDFGDDTPGRWLTQHVPWTDAEHRISAVQASAEIARLLEVPRATACLLLERRTWHEADTVTIERQTFRGDAVDLTARFSPGGAAQISGDT